MEIYKLVGFIRLSWEKDGKTYEGYRYYFISADSTDDEKGSGYKTESFFQVGMRKYDIDSLYYICYNKFGKQLAILV